MADAAYDELYRAMKPGMSENQCVGLVSKVLYDLGSEHVEGVNAISGERCNPHPHVFADRILRPGDPAYFDILHAYLGYRTCYYRTFAIGSASNAASGRLQALPALSRRCHLAHPPGRDDRRRGGDLAQVRRSSASPTRRPPSPCSTGHGIGPLDLGKAVFSGWSCSSTPEVIEEGWSSPLETFWPASDGCLPPASRRSSW